MSHQHGITEGMVREHGKLDSLEINEQELPPLKYMFIYIDKYVTNYICDEYVLCLVDHTSLSVQDSRMTTFTHNVAAFT